MSFQIRSKIAAIKSKGKTPIMEIQFLGCGDSFNTELGNSSCLIKTASGNILIDCGYDVYKKIQDQISDIKYVFVTHAHDDHIGSLSTFAFYKHYALKQGVSIETSDDVAEVLNKFLFEICHMPTEAINMNKNRKDFLLGAQECYKCVYAAKNASCPKRKRKKSIIQPCL